MPFEYIDLAEAKARKGLRMVVVSNVPSPWGEAAKGAFHVKGLDWAAVRLAPEDPELVKWAGASAPAVFHDDDGPRTGWAEILLLAEKLAPDAPLLPIDPGERALAFGLSHEILGEDGLAWSRRAEAIAAGLRGAPGGFHPKIAAYLALKYGHRIEDAERAKARAIDVLRVLASRLHATASAGGLYFGNRLTAVDIHSAAAMALLAPLPEDMCAMNPHTRKVFAHLDEETAEALDPVLLTHRDRVYREWLETPLSL